MMFDALNNTLYRVTFSPKYELYHLANSEENKELKRLNSKLKVDIQNLRDAKGIND